MSEPQPSRPRALAPLGLFAALLSVAPAAHAQQGDARARNMLRQALEDFPNIDANAARGRLNLALRGCGPSACSRPVQAQLHVGLAIVAAVARDSATAVSEFAAALRLDPNAAPEANNRNAEVNAALAQARRGGASAPRRPAASLATLLHTPAPEQLENAPVPVYLEPGGAQASRYVLRYRGLGADSFTELPMERVGGGFGAEVPCAQVLQPSVEYYVVGLSEDGTEVAAAGSEEQPFRVTVVRERSHPAPALPGRMPTQQCSGSGARASGSRGQRQAGDPCSDNNQCAEGLRCDGGSCAQGAPSSVGASASGPDDERYTFAFDVGGSLGIFALAAGDPTMVGSNPPYGTRYAEGNYAYVYPVADPNTPGSFVYRPATPEEANDPASAALATRQIPNAVSDADPSARTSCGYVPPGPAGSPATDFNYNRLQCPTLRTARAAVAGALQLHFRVAPFRGPLGRYFSFSIGARISPDFAAPVASTYRTVYPTSLLPALLPFMAILVRLQVGLYNPHARNGLSLYVYGGAGLGQMQVRAPRDPMLMGDAAHLQAGPGSVSMGLRVEYNFARFVHVAAELGPNFLFPFGLANFDLTAVAGAHF